MSILHVRPKEHRDASYFHFLIIFVSKTCEQCGPTHRFTYRHNRLENVNSWLPLQRRGLSHLYNTDFNNVLTSGSNERMGRGCADRGRLRKRKELGRLARRQRDRLLGSGQHLRRSRHRLGACWKASAHSAPTPPADALAGILRNRWAPRTPRCRRCRSQSRGHATAGAGIKLAEQVRWRHVAESRNRTHLIDSGFAASPRQNSRSRQPARIGWVEAVPASAPARPA